MGKQELITIDPRTGVPRATAERLVRSFLDRHDSGLDDLFRRFPHLPGPAFRSALESCLEPSGAALELEFALERAIGTLLSLQGENCHSLPVDDGRRLQVDAGLRSYAARLHDRSRAARNM